MEPDHYDKHDFDTMKEPCPKKVKPTELGLKSHTGGIKTPCQQGFLVLRREQASLPEKQCIFMRVLFGWRRMVRGGVKCSG